MNRKHSKSKRPVLLRSTVLTLSLDAADLAHVDGARPPSHSFPGDPDPSGPGHGAASSPICRPTN